MARLRMGDSAAFDEAYELYRARLFTFLLRLTGRRDVAEDLLQETWLRLARTAQRLRPDTQLLAWLFTVGRNLYVSQRRRLIVDIDRRRRLALDMPCAPETPFDRRSRRESTEALERALQALPARHREVLLLVGVEGLTPTEAASILSLRPDTLRQRLARARKRLREQLETSERETA